MALLLGLAMLPAGAIAMQVGLNALAARQAAYEEALGRRALQAMDVERRTFDEIREMLRVVASTPDLQEIAANDCANWVNGVLTRYTDLAGLTVTTEDGAVVCTGPVQAPAGFRARSAVRERARVRDTFTMGFNPNSTLLNQPVLAALEPLRGPGGRRIGFISASIKVRTLRNRLNNNGVLADARAAIVDFSGEVIAETDTRRSANAPPLPSPEQVRDHFGEEPRFVAVRGGAAVVAPLHAPDIFFVMSWAPEQPLWRTWSAVAISVAAPVLIWLFAIGAGWFAIEVYVTRPLSNLEGAARAYARGEELPESAALLAAPAEIRSLRRTLAAMAKTLRGREQRLVDALAEERALLREVHHRVKNNLQMVASLLNIQARGARDESEARGLSRAHDRVQLLALVHQGIYSSGAVRTLHVDELAVDIARALMQSRGLQAQNVRFSFSPVRTDADRAAPLAFLIGEAISAALDEVSEEGALTLHLQQDEAEVRFAVDVEGAGSGEASPQSARLIDAFARQLGAQLGRDPSRPSRVWVRVPSG
jgi:two-component sensor histidine kinase